MRYLSTFWALLFLFVCSCKQETSTADYSHIVNSFEVAIHTSAGHTTNQSFLPLMGNLGYMDNDQNIGVLVLSESVEAGKVMNVRPLGMLLIKEANQVKHIIVATPLDTTIRLTESTSFQQFIVENAGEKQIIQDWFLYQNGIGKTDLIGWKNEKEAFNVIN